MAYDSIIVRCGEMFLKGGNLPYFENILLQNTKNITGISAITKLRGRLLLPYFPAHSSLRRVFGISSYSPAFKAEKNLEGLQKTALVLLSKKPGTFKIETRRSDKRFPLTSPQISKEVGQYLEANTTCQFDFAHPGILINIEINNRGAYLYTETVAGAGGLPVGTAGKVHTLIDNENDILAALLMIKRGCDVIPISVGKEIDVSLLQKFSGKKIENIIVQDEQGIAQYIQDHKIVFMITGETFESRKRRNFLIFRPLIGYSKERIEEELKKYELV